MLKRHAINVSIVEDDDHLTENLETIQHSEVNRFPLTRIDRCGQNPEVIDRFYRRRYHKQVLNETRQHRLRSVKKPTSENVWMDLNSDPSPTLKNKRFTSEENLMDLDRSHRRQVCESSSHCKLTKRPTANHTELSL